MHQGAGHISIHLHMHLYNLLVWTLVVRIWKVTFLEMMRAVELQKDHPDTLEASYMQEEWPTGQTEWLTGGAQSGRWRRECRRPTNKVTELTKTKQNKKSHRVTNKHNWTSIPWGKPLQKVENSGSDGGDYYLHLVWFLGKIGGRSTGLISLIKIGQMQMSN